VRGRNFAADEDQAGHHVAILSDCDWERVFARDPKAIASAIPISDVPYTIIGVLPRGFVDPQTEQPQIWASFALYLEGPRAERQRAASGNRR